MSTELPPNHPDQPEPSIPDFSLTDIDDGPEDQAGPDEIISSESSTAASGSATLSLPRVVLGCATFGTGIYADDPSRSQDGMPLRVVRLALRSGITAFDTAPHYHPSEIVLGNALHALRKEWPRSSYQIVTKVGKYGSRTADHVYEPEIIRKSVARSLKRLRTDYLDAVYLHDVEFALPVIPSGNPLEFLSYILESPPTAPIHPGDHTILEAVSTLRSLQSEGVIKHVGIAAYPLPILLRVALLVLNITGKPLDVVQTYAHQTLANSSLTEGYLEALTVQAKVGTVVSASPLGMGLLTSVGPQTWHPARTDLGGKVVDVAAQAAKLCEDRGSKLEDVACDFGFKEVKLPGENRLMPVVVGCKNTEEVHANLKSFKRSQGKEGSEELQQEVQELFEREGVRNWSYRSG